MAAAHGFADVPGCVVHGWGETLTARVGRYLATGHICVLLVNGYGHAYVKASTTDAGISLGHDEVLISEHGENQGIGRLLQDAGLIGPPLAATRLPGVSVHRCLIEVPLPAPNVVHWLLKSTTLVYSL